MNAEAFEDAPCGFVATGLDGTIVRVNRTFERWSGTSRAELVGMRFQDVLSVGARIYYETHYAPLLHMHDEVRGIALDLRRPDGSKLSTILSARRIGDEIVAVLLDATDRRSYEQELLESRRREHDVALRLQRSMLSGELPTADAFTIDVAYRSAVTGLEVGGDWYDAFWLREGETLGLVVGDVVGRGIDAAATMGQLRSALRALAATGMPPAPLLSALDEYVHRHGTGQMTTIVYAELGVETRRMRWCCAGHPPPVIAAPGEQPVVLWEGRSPPLDAFAGTPGRRDDAVVDLAPGSLVLLYSDGLIEQRDTTLLDGIERLAEGVTRYRDRPPGELSATLLHELHDAAHRDDLCLLTLSLSRF